MKRDADIELHSVRAEHIGIHDDLLNWARVVRVSRNMPNACAPIFRLYRTDPHYTDEPSPFLPKKPLDGFEMEKQVRNLPWKSRDAIRWMYVRWHIRAYDMRKELGVTAQGLADLIHDGRSILRNRYKSPVDRVRVTVAEWREI